MSERTGGLASLTGLIFMKLESERVPRKNLRSVGGRPLYKWIFDTLEASRYVTEIILNTDSERIAEEVSRDYPVRIHMRPEHLLRIQSNEANQIIRHDMELADGQYFLQTHSTNPLLSVETLDTAVETFFGEGLPNNFDSLFSVTPHRKRFYYPNGRATNHDPTQLVKTQALSPLLEENSCIYLFSRASFMANGANRIGRRPYLFHMSAAEALDIDTEADLSMADHLLRARRSGQDRE